MERDRRSSQARPAPDDETRRRRQTGRVTPIHPDRRTHMFKNPLKNTRLAALGATVAGIALAVTGVIEVTDTQSAANATVGIEHVSLGAFSLALLALALPITYVGRLAGARRAATIAIVGQVLLALLCVTSNINGKDLGIFPAVAAPTNLMLFGGWAAIAIALRRRAGLSRA